jgi:uncharacterized protein YegP (UPF0339 family)
MVGPCAHPRLLAHWPDPELAVLTHFLTRGASATAATVTLTVIQVSISHSAGGVVTERENSMAGKFELYKDANGKFRFRLMAGNGEIIAVGEAYDSKASAGNGIASVQKNAPDATVVDLTE